MIRGIICIRGRRGIRRWAMRFRWSGLLGFHRASCVRGGRVEGCEHVVRRPGDAPWIRERLLRRVVNADAVPGTITLEVVLSDASGKRGSSVSLGSKVLASSTVLPMPLHRAPVNETLVFQIPRGAKNVKFDAITVKVKPEGLRSLAAPEVAIESFAFQQ